MRKDTFLHEIKGRAVIIGNNWLFAKPAQVWNKEKDTTEKFKNAEDMYENAFVDGVKLKDIVKDADMSLFDVQIDDSSLKTKE